MALGVPILKHFRVYFISTLHSQDRGRIQNGAQDWQTFCWYQNTGALKFGTNCTARQCSPLRRKFMECSINSPALSLLMKHLVIGQRLNTPNFSAFHWSPRGSLVSIGQHFVATRVVHLPKSTKTSLITESDQSGPNHQLLQLCTTRTAWSDADQVVRAVHSCNSWLYN